jgi:hypothetical protein
MVLIPQTHMHSNKSNLIRRNPGDEKRNIFRDSVGLAITNTQCKCIECAIPFSRARFDQKIDGPRPAFGPKSRRIAADIAKLPDELQRTTLKSPRSGEGQKFLVSHAEKAA